jgi:lysophospholipase
MSKALDTHAKAAEGFRFGKTRDSADVMDLRYGVLPARTTAKRFVVFLNGRTEWIEKYAYLPHDLGLPPDCGFLTFDHRGQGASGGARAFVDSYDSYARDAAKIVREQVGDLPYAVLSHSMGGLISLYATLKGQLNPALLVLSSPLLGMPTHPVPVKVAKPLSALLTLGGLGAVSSGGGSFTMEPFERNRLTHCIDRYTRMQESPYKVPGATFGWVRASFAAIAECRRPDLLAKLTAPTLVIGGTKETVVDFSAFRSFVELAAQHAPAPVKLTLIPDARHELFSEIPRLYALTLENVRAFLKDFLA